MEPVSLAVLIGNCFKVGGDFIYHPPANNKKKNLMSTQEMTAAGVLEKFSWKDMESSMLFHVTSDLPVHFILPAVAARLYKG